ALGQGLGEVHAVALTPRQLADLLLLVAAAEVERADVGAGVDLAVPDLQHVEAARDLLPDGVAGPKRVATLVDVSELDGLAEADGAGVGLLLTGDQLEQGRLAGAVGADDADDAVGRQLEREALEQDLVAVLLLQA